MGLLKYFVLYMSFKPWRLYDLCVTASIRQCGLSEVGSHTLLSLKLGNVRVGIVLIFFAFLTFLNTSFFVHFTINVWS